MRTAGAISSLLVAFLFVTLGAACSSSSAGSAPQDGATTDGGDGGDGAAAPMTCQQIRLCALGCGDQACIQTCEARGTADARTTFEALLSCANTNCPTNEMSCVCREECQIDGFCFDQVGACLGGSTADPICDNLCH